MTRYAFVLLAIVPQHRVPIAFHNLQKCNPSDGSLATLDAGINDAEHA